MNIQVTKKTMAIASLTWFVAFLTLPIVSCVSAPKKATSFAHADIKTEDIDITEGRIFFES